MKTMFNRNTKGQTLLFAFIFALLAAILVTGIALLWQADVQTTALARDGLVAFYIAQAGFARANAALSQYAFDNDATPALIDDYEDDFDENFGPGYYNASVKIRPAGGGCGAKACKYILSKGHYRDSERWINMTIRKNVGGGVPKGHAWGWHKKGANTWGEN